MRKHLRRPSPAMGVALIALFIALGGTTYAATGDNFILGQPNSASNQTSLTAPVSAATAGGNKVLQLTNTSTATGAQGLGISVGANKTPIFVNANAGKATNLNADKLDGLDSTALQRRVNGTCTGAQAVNGIDVGGSVGCGATRPEPRITNTPVLIPSSTTFTTDGGPVLIQTAPGRSAWSPPSTASRGSERLCSRVRRPATRPLHRTCSGPLSMPASTRSESRRTWTHR
jgi:hypothetical protein